MDVADVGTVAVSSVPSTAAGLNRRGTRGLVGAAAVWLALLLVVALSKLNEVRQQRLPSRWRARIRGMVLESARNLRVAEETLEPYVAYGHALRADAMLQSAQSIVGPADLTNLAGLDTERLAEDIQRFLDSSSAAASAPPNNTATTSLSPAMPPRESPVRTARTAAAPTASAVRSGLARRPSAGIHSSTRHRSRSARR